MTDDEDKVKNHFMLNLEKIQQFIDNGTLTSFYIAAETKDENGTYHMGSALGTVDCEIFTSQIVSDLINKQNGELEFILACLRSKQPINKKVH